jgi:hypothetical protein
MAIKKAPAIAPPSFAERLAYARWVRQLTTNAPEESDMELVRRSGVKQPWFSKWKGRDDVPPGREILQLADALGVSWQWLEGQDRPPPLPSLWRDWFAARRGNPVAPSDPRYITADLDLVDPRSDRLLTEAEVERAETKTAAKRDAAAAGGKRPAKGA